MKQFYDLPKNYASEPLRRENLASRPLEQFLHWIDEAEKAGVAEVNAMALATASLSGKPSCRTVLLKQVDERGWVFFTNYQSRKAKELMENPRAMSMLFWQELMRQVCVEGRVEKISEEESKAYFAKRPRGSQIGAWASPQDRPIQSRDFLVNEVNKFEMQFQGQDVSYPPFWGGFRIIPERYEFWQGGKNRLHDRFEYTLLKERWEIQRLAP